MEATNSFHTSVGSGNWLIKLRFFISVYLYIGKDEVVRISRSGICCDILEIKDGVV